MEPAPVGTPIIVTSNKNSHSYRVGGRYVVSYVDPSDATFRAADENGKSLNWLRWEDARHAGVSDWSRIAASLPEELVAFLSAFDAIANIRLNTSVVDGVLERVPNLHERIVAVAMSSEGKSHLSSNHPLPIDQD
jgi:hypothetical protein